MYRPSLSEFREKAKISNLIPVYKEILADMETPVSALYKIDRGEHAFLLESVEGGEKLAQYSFLGCEPSLIFQSQEKEVKISAANGDVKTFSSEDPFKELERLMSKYKPALVKGLPRFHGGAVGFISYDTVRFFEKLPQISHDDLHMPDLMFMITDTILVFDHVNHKIKVVSNAHISEKNGDVDSAYINAIEKIEGLIAALRMPLMRPLPKTQKRVTINPMSNFTEEGFKNIVLRGKEYIKAGDVVQVVLSQRLRMPISAEAFDIYRALRTVNPSPYMYYLKFGQLKVAGSSPEVMVRVEDNLIQMRPIAGTRPRGQTEDEDNQLQAELLADPKERAEHVMLVDLGRNDVGRVCNYGSVKVDELMVIEKYSHVMHIVSNVVGKLRKNRNAFDVIRACFPAGTVSGAPKIRAMEIIEELEPHRRGPYAGAVGYFSFSGNSDTGITIRTILIKDGIAYAQAGAGIVADSVPENEYQETMNKAKASLRAIQLAEEGLE